MANSTVVTIDSMFQCPACGHAEELPQLPDVGEVVKCIECGGISYAARESSVRSIEWAIEQRTLVLCEKRVRTEVGEFTCPYCSTRVAQPKLMVAPSLSSYRSFSLETMCPGCHKNSALLESSLWGQWRWQLKSSPRSPWVWLCNECLPEAVCMSTIGGYRETCILCGQEKDRNVMKHVLPCNFPDRLKKFVAMMKEMP